MYFGDWELVGPDGVLASEVDDHAVIDRAVKLFAGTQLVDVNIDASSLDTTFEFERGLRVHIGSNSDDLVPDADWWLLFTPDDRVLVVGPGPSWSYKSSREP